MSIAVVGDASLTAIGPPLSVCDHASYREIGPLFATVPFHVTLYVTFVPVRATSVATGALTFGRERGQYEPVDRVALPHVVLHHPPRDAAEAPVRPTRSPRVLHDQTRGVVADRQHLVVTADSRGDVVVDRGRARSEEVESAAHGNLDRDRMVRRDRMLQQCRAPGLVRAHEQREGVLDLELRRVRALGRGRRRLPVVVTLGVVRAGVVALCAGDLERIAREAAAVTGTEMDLRVRVHRRERLTDATVELGVPTEHRVVDRPGDARADLTLVTGRHRPLAQVDTRGEHGESGNPSRLRRHSPDRAQGPETVAGDDGLCRRTAGRRRTCGHHGRRRRDDNERRGETEVSEHETQLRPVPTADVPKSPPHDTCHMTTGRLRSASLVRW